jgi:hypothetical protein
VNRTLNIGVCLGACPGAIPQATNFDIVLTAPNSVVTTTNCTTSPCSVTADARQGDYQMVVKYKSTDGKVLAQGDPQTIVVK